MGCEHTVKTGYAIPMSMPQFVDKFTETSPSGTSRFTIEMKEPFKSIEQDLNEFANECFQNVRLVFLKHIISSKIMDEGDIPIKIGDHTFMITYAGCNESMYTVYSDLNEGLYVYIPLKDNTLASANEKFRQFSEITGIGGTPEKYVEVLWG